MKGELDWIERSARALREESDGTSADAERTRARILATRARRERRTYWAMAAAAMLALGLGVPTAWAWTTGRLDAWIDAIGGEDAAPAPQITPAPAPREEAPPVEEIAPPVPAVEVVAPVEPVAPPEVERPVDPAERRAYERAHQSHFEARDPAAALEAWNDYLAAYPRGRFALEARYNRALCLVRLDRRSDARAALAPFANGEHGEYRRREAQALIDAMDVTAGGVPRSGTR